MYKEYRAQLRPAGFLSSQQIAQLSSHQGVYPIKQKRADGTIGFFVDGIDVTSSFVDGAMTYANLQNEREQHSAAARAQREANNRHHKGSPSRIAAAGGAGGAGGQLSLKDVREPNTNKSAKVAGGVAATRRFNEVRLRSQWSHNDNSQAEFLWGKCNSTTNICYCCICGWPIIPDGGLLFPNETVGTVFPRWGQGSAEHELYASKGYRYIGLYWSKILNLKKAGLPNGFTDNVINFYKKEMMWSHWYCNNVKNDVSLIKWTDDDTNLVPNFNNIRYIINSVWNGVAKVKSSIDRRYIDEKGVEVIKDNIKYAHLIHYFLSTTKPIPTTLEQWNARVLAWKNNRLCAYVTRLNDMINNLRSCCAAIFPGIQFNIALRRILDERTANPYGLYLKTSLTAWPPNISISPTPAPAKANFNQCLNQKVSTFWDNVDPEDNDEEYLPSATDVLDYEYNARPNSANKELANQGQFLAAMSAAGGGGKKSRHHTRRLKKFRQRKTRKSVT